MSKKISDLDPVIVAAVGDEHEVNQGGVSYRETNTQILDLVSNGAYNFSSVGVGAGPGISLLGDGSAVYAGGGLVFGADGSITQTLGAFTLAADGSATFASQVSWDINGNMTAESLAIHGTNITLSTSGAISAADSVTAVNLVRSNNRVQADAVFNCNTQDGLTGDFSILVSGVPKNFHFEGGILTSVT